MLSLLLSIGFLAVHLPAALLLGPMIAGIIFSMRGITLQLPRSAFLAAQAILGCMIAQNLTGSILTTLAANWPIVLAILLVTLLSSAIIELVIGALFSLPGNTNSWVLLRAARGRWSLWRKICGAVRGGVYAISASAVGRGGRCLVTRMMLGDNA
ncbi:AbrB family transcriptional regulator [Shigella flexneri]